MANVLEDPVQGSAALQGEAHRAHVLPVSLSTPAVRVAEDRKAAEQGLSLITCHLSLNERLQIQILSTEATSDLLKQLVCIVQLGPQTDAITSRIIIGTPGDRAGHAGGENAKMVFSIRSRVRVWQQDCSPDFFFELCATPEELAENGHSRLGMIATILGTLWVLFSDEITLMHGALVTRNGEAVVLAGPSGVGKSTAARRVPLPWKAIVDDTVAIVQNAGSGFSVHALPTWSAFFDKPGPGQSVDLNAGYPLKQIFFLEQAADDACVPMRVSDAVSRLVQSSLQVYAVYWGGLDTSTLLKIKRDLLVNATSIVQATDPVLLQVAREGKFWELMN